MRIKVKQLRAIAKQCGYEGDQSDIAAIKKFLVESGATASLEDGTEIDFKTVYVVSDAGEEVVLQDATEMETEMAEDEDEESKSEDDEREDEKSARIKQLEAELKTAKYKAKGTVAPKIMAVTAGLGSKGGSAESRERIAARKAYDRKAAKGETRFSDSETAERFAASFRLKCAETFPAKFGNYDQKASDLDVLGVKTLNTYTNNTAGATVFDEFSADLIALFEEFGAARGLVGVTPMSSLRLTNIRETDGIAAAWDTEGDAIVPQDRPGYDNPSLDLRRLSAAVRVSNELLKFSAINVADRIATRFATAVAEKEDDAYINGDGGSTYGNNVGLVNALNASAVTTGAGNTWDAITYKDLLKLVGSVSGNAATGGLSWLMSREAHFQVVQGILSGGGGNTGDMLASGFANQTLMGYPVVYSTKAPRATATNTQFAWFGNFSLGSKFGEQVGGLEIEPSEHSRFLNYETEWRAVNYVGINIHEDGADADQRPIVALKTDS